VAQLRRNSSLEEVGNMKFAASTVQTLHDSALGPIILAANKKHLVGIWFAGQRHQPDISHWAIDEHHPLLQRVKTAIDEYFAGQRH
jgi:methylated-DNA-[protein]-cysteine S-methyltransferase